MVVIRDHDRNRAYDFAHACAAAGATALEITTTVPGSPALVARLREELPETLVGAGTLHTPGQVRDHADAGAAFLVAPGLDSAVVRVAAAAGVPVVPGVLTASEVTAAVGLGLDTVKLFPADTVGPGHLRAFRSVFPTLAFVPTGGVTHTTAASWRAAGACAVPKR